MFSFIKGVRERLSIIKDQVQQPSDIQELEIVVLDLTKRVISDLDRKFQVGLHYPPAQSIDEMYKQKAEERKAERYRRDLEDAQG